MRFSTLATLCAVTAIGHALPNNLQARGTILAESFCLRPPLTNFFADVPADELSQFKFWVEYAAASYCYDNYASKPGHKLTCSAHNCPQVEQSDTSIVYDFSK